MSRRICGKGRVLGLVTLSVSSVNGGRGRVVDAQHDQGASGFVRRKLITYPGAICSIQARIMFDVTFR